MKKWIIRILLILLCLIVVIGGIITFNGYNVYKNALDTISLSDRVDKVKEDENYIILEDLPTDYKNAVVSVEDRRFYNHGPIDLIGIARATFTNIKSRAFLEGGSTITQQVAKNLYFISDDENPMLRKIAEIFMAYDLENTYKDKDFILELYVNTIYFGDGYYGVQEACQGYFNKDAQDMTLFESTMLAGTPNAPSVYAPTVNMDLALSRQRKVISTMVENKYLTKEQADKLINDQTTFELPKK